MITVFWNYKSIIAVDYVPKETTIIANRSDPIAGLLHQYIIKKKNHVIRNLMYLLEIPF